MEEKEVAQLFGSNVVVVDASPAPETAVVDPVQLKIIVASMFSYPMESVKVVDHVGRFYQVAYIPVHSRDPQTLVTLGSAPADMAFRRAMAALQAARRRQDGTPREWMQRAKNAARQIGQPLAVLHPTQEEAKFVWDVIAGWIFGGERVRDFIAQPVLQDDLPGRSAAVDVRALAIQMAESIAAERLANERDRKAHQVSEIVATGIALAFWAAVIVGFLVWVF